MHRLLLCLFSVFAILLISVTCQPDAMLAPPGRPKEFRTPDQLRSYLKALNDYYAIVGRPRFGRSVNKQPLSRSYGDANINGGIDFGYFWDDAFKPRDPLENMAEEEEYPIF